MIKVARHAPCLRGWRLHPDPDSPYDPMPEVALPGERCDCPGLTPAGRGPVALEARQFTLPELNTMWRVCGRCAHPLRDHGQLLLDPAQERLRRAKVAIRIDELLEDEHKLDDWTYTDPDVQSLKKYVA